MASSKTGSSEELRLRIVPELDTQALKTAENQLNALKSTTTVGGTGKGAASAGQTNAVKQQVAALKELLAVERLAIDQTDLRLRKTRSAATAEIASIRERAAAGKISMQQMNTLISQQDALIENAANDAARSYQQVGASLQGLQTQYAGVANAQQLIVNREKQLFFAQQRMSSGFISMSGSMQTMVSQTKNANLAFMNFGRIVQDAPFGLIGISNNIDPLLMSFRALSTEVDATTGKVRGAMGAFRAMGAQLFGPAGLIFLLGSALPTALLFLQRRQQQQAAATKDITNEAVQFASKILDMKSKVELATIGFIDQDKVVQEYNETLAKTFGSVNNLNEVNDKLVQNTDKFIQSMVLRAQAQILINEAAQTFVDIVSGKEQERSFLEGLEYQDRITEKVNKIKETQFISLKQELALRKELKKVVDEEILNEKRQEASGKQAEATKLLGEAFNLTKGINGEEEKKSKYFDKSIVDQTKLNILSQNYLDQSKDSSKTWEERLSLVEKGIYYQKASLNLQIKSLEEQKNASKDAGEQLKLESEILVKKQELIRADQVLVEFQKEMENARIEESARFSEFVNADIQNRLNNEKKALDEILKSQFINNEQRIKATEAYYKKIADIVKNFEQAAIKADDDFAEKRLQNLKKTQPLQGKSEYDTFLENRGAMLDADLQFAELTNNRNLQITANAEIQKANLYEQYRKLNLLGTERYTQAVKAIETNAAKQTAQLRLDTFTETFQALGQLASSLVSHVFEDEKKGAIAQVIIDTAMGVQKIWANTGMNPIVGGLLTAALVANGAAAISKIQKTEVGDQSIGGTGSGKKVETSVLNARAADVIRENNARIISGQNVVSAAGPMNTGMPAFMIEAKLDRDGLALAVRDGERSIKSKQISYM